MLEEEFDTEPTFDSMIRLRNHICIIAYSLPNNKNAIKIIIKKVQNINSKTGEFSIDDFIPKIPEIILNEDNLYKFEGAKSSSNSLVQISYEKFALLVNDFKNSTSDLNSDIVIFILNMDETNSFELFS